MLTTIGLPCLRYLIISSYMAADPRALPPARHAIDWKKNLFSLHCIASAVLITLANIDHNSNLTVSDMYASDECTNSMDPKTEVL